MKFYTYVLPKNLQRIQLNKTEAIKSKWKWQKILKFQYRFKIQNIQLSRRLFTRNYFGLKVQYNFKIGICKVSKSAKICDWKTNIGWSPELLNDIFEFIEKPYSLRINSQFRPEDPSDKRKTEKYGTESFYK